MLRTPRLLALPTQLNQRCGSIAAASRGEIEKNSHRTHLGCQLVRKPPSVLQMVPARCDHHSSRRRRPHAAEPDDTLRPAHNKSWARELFGVVDPAREPATHADHRDRFAAGFFGDFQARRGDHRSCAASRSLTDLVAIVFLLAVPKIVPTTRLRSPVGVGLLGCDCGCPNF